MKRLQHWHRAKLLASLLILSLLTSWLGVPSAAFASGKLKSCQDICIPGTDPPDFTLDVAPASQTVEQGGDITYTVTISSINCYTGTITLSLSGLPGGATHGFDPETLDTFGDSVLTISTAQDTPPDDYTLTISGDSGDLHHEVNVNLTIEDNPGSEPYFTLAASPVSQAVDPGNGADYTVGVEGHNGFGTLALPVSLSVSGLPSGATAAFSPNNLAMAGEERTLSVSIAAGTPPDDYELTISGDSGDLHHEVSVNLTVNPDPDPYFTLDVSPTSQTVDAGNGVDYTVGVEGHNGFGGTLAVPVALSISGLPSGATATFSPDNQPLAGEERTLSVSTAADTPPDDYELTVSGDSGDLHHETSVTLAVQNPGSQALVSISSAPSSVFVGHTVESEVLLSNASDFYGIEFFMSYDPAVLQVVDADPALPGVQIGLGEIFPSDQHTIGVNEVNTVTGQISLGVARLSPLPPVNGDGVLAHITWEAVGEGVSELNFTHTKLASPDGTELDAVSQNGVITTILTGKLEGTVKPQGRFDYSGVEINLSPAGLQLFTDALGWFSALIHGDLTVTAHMHGYLDAQATVYVAPGAVVDLGPTTLYGGEVTGDNLIDILDLAYMGARFHGSDLSADINGDGIVDILDLVLSAANYMMTGPTDWAE
jgi:uncharacterized membrane protein